MTVYDMFKNMTVDQLAVFLFPQGSSNSCPLYKLHICECNGYPNSNSGKKYCIDQIVSWLNSEVELEDIKFINR